MATKTTLIVRFQIPGLHHWPEAPKHLLFIKHLHRHIFFFDVEIDVDNNDREIEFFEAQQYCISRLQHLFSSVLAEGGINFHSYSCEQIAESLLKDLMSVYRIKSVLVSEDNENGARVNWEE